MPIKAVIFDFGGVMVLREDWSAQQKWEKHLGLREKELPETVYLSEVGNRATLGQATTEEVWQYLGNLPNAPPTLILTNRTSCWKL